MSEKKACLSHVGGQQSATYHLSCLLQLPTPKAPRRLHCRKPSLYSYQKSISAFSSKLNVNSELLVWALALLPSGKRLPNCGALGALF